MNILMSPLFICDIFSRKTPLVLITFASDSHLVEITHPLVYCVWQLSVFSHWVITFLVLQMATDT